MEKLFPLQETSQVSYELPEDMYEQLATTKKPTCPECHTHDFRCDDDGCYWLAMAQTEVA
jgi:hypothetical protein